MSVYKSGGKAFPYGEEGHQQGMTLRDYFAGQALAGLCAQGRGVEINGVAMSHNDAAYLIADGMIATREKGVPS